MLEQPNRWLCLGVVMSYNLLRHTGGASTAVSNSSPSHSPTLHTWLHKLHVYRHARVRKRFYLYPHAPEGAGCPSNLCFRLEPSNLRCPGEGKSLCFTEAQLVKNWLSLLRYFLFRVDNHKISSEFL